MAKAGGNKNFNPHPVKEVETNQQKRNLPKLARLRLNQPEW